MADIIKYNDSYELEVIDDEEDLQEEDLQGYPQEEIFVTIDPTWLWLGLGALALFGLGWYLSRRGQAQLQGTSQPNIQYVPQVLPIPWPIGSDKAGEATERLLELFSKDTATKGKRTYMGTYVLPFVGDRNAVPQQIVQAGVRPYEVIVRVIQPPGGFALIAFDPAELMNRPVRTNSTSTTVYTTFPMGGLVVIPSGCAQKIRLAPGQALYAIGTVGPVSGNPNQQSSDARVAVSVTASDY